MSAEADHKMDDKEKSWQNGEYTGRKKPKPPKSIKRKSHNDWFLNKKILGEQRIKCLDRFCETLVNPNINPYCRKCRRKKRHRFIKADYKKRRDENQLQKESENDG